MPSSLLVSCLAPSRSRSLFWSILQLIIKKSEGEESDGKGRKRKVLSLLFLPILPARALRSFPSSFTLGLITRLQQPALKVRVPH